MQRPRKSYPFSWVVPCERARVRTDRQKWVRPRKIADVTKKNKTRSIFKIKLNPLKEKFLNTILELLSGGISFEKTEDV